MKLTDFKQVLITGATSDLGQELIFSLKSHVSSFILTAPNPQKLKKLQATLSPLKIKILPADLTKDIDRFKVIQSLRHNTPDLIINNAGAGLYGLAISYPVQQQLDLLELNGKALMEITLEGAHSLHQKKKKGIIVNIGSAAAAFPFPTFSVYAASKAFVESFSQSLDTEMSPYGIRILCLSPGQIATQFRVKASQNQQLKTTSWMTLSTKSVASALLHQIEKELPYQRIDWRYKLGAHICRLIPKKWVDTLFMQSIQKRLP